jgi:hypothetical protein
MTSQAIPRGHHPGPRKGEVLDTEPQLGAPCGFQCQDKTQWDFKARVKSRHETFNGRIKSFLVLAMPFRHDISQHKQCFESVCLAVQYDIENGHPLFEI